MCGSFIDRARSSQEAIVAYRPGWPGAECSLRFVGMAGVTVRRWWKARNEP